MSKPILKILARFVQPIQFRSIQFIITAAVTLISVSAMLFVGIVLYDKFSRTAEQNVKINTEQIIEQVKINLEYYLEGTGLIFQQADDKQSQVQGVPDAKLLEQLNIIMNTRNDIVSVGIFTADGEPVLGLPNKDLRMNTGLTQQSWFRSAVDNPKHVTVSVPHVQNLYKGQYKWVVSISKGITIVRNDVTVPAVLLMDVNFKNIEDLCRRVSLGKKGYVYIIDESAGNIVYHPQQQLIYNGLKYENVEQAIKFTYGSYIDTSNGEKRLITVKTVENIGWKIIGVSYLDEVVATKKELGGYIIWLLVFVIVVVLLISVFMSARISRPIKRLKKSMEKVEKGDFDTIIHVKGADEVEQLSRRFNLMVSRIRQLMDQIILEQEAKRKYEMEVLHAQINPHFLYNTLNSAVRMVGTGKKEDAVTTITSLSKLFRISLSKGKNIIPVRDELEHIRNYLVIQKMRFKSKFEYTIEADEEVLQYQTLKLVLQPIVENAIHHGIECMADEGMIRISAVKERDCLLFTVKDNGVGMSAETLEQLQRGTVNSPKGSGVGVRNVRDRIQLYFGEEYGLQIESQLEEGTTVMIRMPLVAEEEEGKP